MGYHGLSWLRGLGCAFLVSRTAGAAAHASTVAVPAQTLRADFGHWSARERGLLWSHFCAQFIFSAGQWFISPYNRPSFFSDDGSGAPSELVGCARE